MSNLATNCLIAWKHFYIFPIIKGVFFTKLIIYIITQDCRRNDYYTVEDYYTVDDYHTVDDYYTVDNTKKLRRIVKSAIFPATTFNNLHKKWVWRDMNFAPYVSYIITILSTTTLFTFPIIVSYVSKFKETQLWDFITLLINETLQTITKM